MKNTYRNSRGFTMIEMIAVMVVIGIILSAVLPALLGAMNNSRLTNAVATVRSLQTASVNYYNGNGGSYANLSLATLASGGYLPANFTSGTNQNPWNGNLTVAPDANASYFDITFTAVPSNQQAALTTATSKLTQTAPTYTAATGTWTAAF